MKTKVVASELNGTVRAPASKSAMQRACALALLNDGTTIIRGPGISNDDKAAINIIKSLGASVKENENGDLIIKSNGTVNPSSTIHCGESGLSLRMFTPIVGMSSKQVSITGEGSLLKRPVNFFDEVLPSLNVNISTDNGFLPVSINGPLQPKDIVIDGSQSSQYLTGLLFAFAKATKTDVSIKVKGLTSKPYIELSLEMLEHFGYQVVNYSFTRFDIAAVTQAVREFEYETEGDWSGAAFLLVAAAIAGNVTVTGLRMLSLQADRAILKVLHDCGAAVAADESSITVHKVKNLKAFNFDATDCPDLFPPLAILAAYCDGTSIITGTGRLINKESNRSDVLYEVLSKMGIGVYINNNTMSITGGVVNGVEVNSHNDHRIAMACAVAGLASNGEMLIEGAEAIKKSYPSFFDDLKKVGGQITILQQYS